MQAQHIFTLIFTLMGVAPFGVTTTPEGVFLLYVCQFQNYYSLIFNILLSVAIPVILYRVFLADDFVRHPTLPLSMIAIRMVCICVILNRQYSSRERIVECANKLIQANGIKRSWRSAAILVADLSVIAFRAALNVVYPSGDFSRCYASVQVFTDLVFHFVSNQFIVLVYLLKKQLTMMNGEIKQTLLRPANVWLVNVPVGKVNMERSVVKQLMRRQERLWDCHQQVNRAYSMQIYTVIMMVIMDMTSNVYSAVTQNEKSWRILFLLAPLPYTLYVFFILILCDITKKEADRTAVLVSNALSVPSMPSSVLDEIRDFTLQLLNRKFDFVAWRIIVLDATKIHSIIMAVVTYVVIFLQGNSRSPQTTLATIDSNMTSV